MERLFQIVKPEYMFALVIIVLSFINETTRFICNLYYSVDNDNRCVFNKKLNGDNHFNTRKNIDAKKLNRTFYILIMLSLVVGIIVMFAFNILAGFAIYIFLYITTIGIYIRYLLNSFHKDLVN